MSFFGSLGDWFKSLGKHIVGALNAAGARGLTDDLVTLALEWVKVAATKELDNDQRRQFVVQLLVGKGIPESIARLATELAYQLFRKELTRI